MSGLRFYLGVHYADWLEELWVPMCASHHILADRRTLPRASAPWICDSGAYSHLDKYGAWRISPEQYAVAVRRYRDEVGRLQWAIQDLMCEPVLQGWSVPGDYDLCHALYERAGIDLSAEPVVGLGSVCLPGRLSCCDWSCWQANARRMFALRWFPGRGSMTKCRSHPRHYSLGRPTCSRLSRRGRRCSGALTPRASR